MTLFALLLYVIIPAGAIGIVILTLAVLAKDKRQAAIWKKIDATANRTKVQK
jgi:hypothetical protein